MEQFVLENLSSSKTFYMATAAENCHIIVEELLQQSTRSSRHCVEIKKDKWKLKFKKVGSTGPRSSFQNQLHSKKLNYLWINDWFLIVIR